MLILRCDQGQNLKFSVLNPKAVMPLVFYALIAVHLQLLLGADGQGQGPTNSKIATPPWL
jgi:hypothetical protein